MDYDSFKRGKLSKLENKLYSRNAPQILDEGRTSLEKETDEVDESVFQKTSWQDLKNSSFNELASKATIMANKKHTFVKKIFIVSLIFFIISIGVASFIFFGGMNFVSSKKVDIQVDSPISIAGGQEVELDIKIINNNNTDLESASLLVEYPKGTRSAEDVTKELERERFTLEKIKKGEDFTKNVKAVFFGEKGETKQVKISLEYRVVNSSALFYKEKIHELSISSAPIIITPTYPKEVNSNQDITFNIEVASNSKDTLNDFLVDVEYPFGFVFKDSSPKALFNNDIWKFATLKSGEKRTIRITGTIIGQNNEERVFRINAGTANRDDEREIAVPLSQLTESILVKKPFIGLEFLVDGAPKDYLTQSSGQVGAQINVSNNLPTRLFNATVEVSFSGGAFDKLAVVPANNGFFQSSNNTILWDKRSVPELADIAPGDSEKMSFRISPLDYSRIPSGASSNIFMTVTVRGEQVLDSGSVQQVSATETRKIVLGSEVSLSARSTRSLGSIENYGDVPPRVDSPTTYTIVWSIKNSLNQISNVQVKATLPPYVKWTDSKSPSSELISYNSVTNEVIWNVGSILPNTNSSSASKQVYFQLEFLPSTSQIGQTPNLIGPATLTGIDKVTGLQVKTQAGSATINFAPDSTYKQGDEVVIQ